MLMNQISHDRLTIGIDPPGLALRGTLRLEYQCERSLMAPNILLANEAAFIIFIIFFYFGSSGAQL